MSQHPAPKRDHLLEVATSLFHRYGYHAVGLDRILETSEVSRTTLFKHFSGKDALIVSALERRDKQARKRFLGMTKNGDRYLRTMLIHGARAAITWSRNKQTPLAQWVNPMVVRRGMNKTMVALANKNARIGWLIVA